MADRISALLRYAKELDVARLAALDELESTKRCATEEVVSLRDRFKAELTAARTACEDAVAEAA